MINLYDDTKVTDALSQWRGRKLWPSEFGSEELRAFSRETMLRSIVSARTTNAEYVQDIAGTVDEILTGKINMATGRLRLLMKLRELGYDPMTGFPHDMAAVPPAERGSLQDLSSTRRLNLLLETNVRIAQNYGRFLAGNTEYERREYPGWELARLYWRRMQRGSEQSHTDGWQLRWSRAGESVDWVGAVERPMVARKDSPIWAALGEGAGGYRDTLGNPFPPFAFGSGMGWKPRSKADCDGLGLLGEHDAVPRRTKASFAPAASGIVKAYDALAPDLQAELKRELAALGL